MNKTGVKQTGESFRDNWITPKYILDKVNEFYFGMKWFDPFPVNPEFDIFMLAKFPYYTQMYINPPFSRYAQAVEHLRKFSGEQIWVIENGKS